MTWLTETLDRLKEQPAIGYLPGGSVAAEPTAVAALALVAHGEREAGRQAGTALASMQQTSGEVSIRAGEQSPGWPTSLAVVAWCAAQKAADAAPRTAFQPNIDQAVSWLLANRGCAIQRTQEFGHNPMLVGWAYAEQTHSWVEPTAFGVLALKAAGRADEPEAREGVAVLIDRQLPGGGLNYGNTFVLGQLIRSHVQPTGIALIALAGANDTSGRLAKSVAWLRRNIGPDTTPQSLAWALLGLRAQGVVLPEADEWLAAAAAKLRSSPVSLADVGEPKGTTSNVPDSPPQVTYKLALLALAAKGWPL
jgi:hypothetical protein